MFLLRLQPTIAALIFSLDLVCKKGQPNSQCKPKQFEIANLHRLIKLIAQNQQLHPKLKVEQFTAPRTSIRVTAKHTAKCKLSHVTPQNELVNKQLPQSLLVLRFCVPSAFRISVQCPQSIYLTDNAASLPSTEGHGNCCTRKVESAEPRNGTLPHFSEDLEGPV